MVVSSFVYLVAPTQHSKHSTSDNTNNPLPINTIINPGYIESYDERNLIVSAHVLLFNKYVICSIPIE